MGLLSESKILAIVSTPNTCYKVTIKWLCKKKRKTYNRCYISTSFQNLFPIDLKPLLRKFSTWHLSIKNSSWRTTGSLESYCSLWQCECPETFIPQPAAGETLSLHFLLSQVPGFSARVLLPLSSVPSIKQPGSCVPKRGPCSHGDAKLPDWTRTTLCIPAVSLMMILRSIKLKRMWNRDVILPETNPAGANSRSAQAWAYLTLGDTNASQRETVTVGPEDKGQAGEGRASETLHGCRGLS